MNSIFTEKAVFGRSFHNEFPEHFYKFLFSWRFSEHVFWYLISLYTFLRKSFNYLERKMSKYSKRISILYFQSSSLF